MAICRWFQPAWFRCQARKRRHSRQSVGSKRPGSMPYYRAERLSFFMQRSVSNQYNARFNAVMQDWRERLFPKGRPVLEFPSDCGSTFRFRLSRVPKFVGVGKAGQSQLPLRDEDKPFITQGGVALSEPALVFANRRADGSVAHDAHPIRGMVENQPFDYGLTRKGLADRVLLAVVCPRREGPQFERYFRGVLQQQSPTARERDYLLDFPGFQTAFGLSLQSRLVTVRGG